MGADGPVAKRGPGRAAAGALAVLLVGAAGCGDWVEVAAEQPIAFDHAGHVGRFEDGKHRAQMEALHQEALGEVPDEVRQGRCTECHESDLKDTGACAGCHLMFQQPELRARREIRACVACHRGTWTGKLASIPSPVVCAACHSATGEPKTASPQEAKLRTFLAERKDIPWIRIHTLVDHVRFSHRAHVRLAGFACTTCHEEMRSRREPPTRARVFTMGQCIQCHQHGGGSHGAGSTECLACHS